MIDLTRERADRQMTYAPVIDGGCESTYELHEGLRVIPILGDPTDSPEIVRVHSAYTIRRVAFSYNKGAHPPLIPSPGTTRTGHTFLSGQLTIPAPGTSGEGGALSYRASGFYNFVLPQHATYAGKLMFDAWPYITGVDMLGADNGSQGPDDTEYGGFYNTWKSQYFDLGILASNRILG